MVQKNIRHFSLIQMLVCSLFLICSCAKKSDVQEAQGDLQVQIGLQNSASSYALQTVQLKGIEKLNEVAGTYAKFFYSPGSENDQLTGTAPHANFIKAKSFFVPSDLVSMQMATIYYHIQKLAEFDKAIGAGEVNQWPRSIGIETQIIDSSSGALRNNAFYNGQTDSMMFVPFNTSYLPIAMNAGIIAHEHFHSLFYKLVIRPAVQAKKIVLATASVHRDDLEVLSKVKSKLTVPKIISDKERTVLFNETFLRGLNEGLADFWGWSYTDDPDFMRWSLPQFQEYRTLQLSPFLEEGKFETELLLFQKIDLEVQMTENPRAALTFYVYQVGTPYARFLKQLALMVAETKNINITESKKLVAQLVLNYMKDLATKVIKLEENENVNPLSLFQYVASSAEKNELIQLDQKSCLFVKKYINYQVTDEKNLVSCKQINEQSSILVKP
jgi:hypothetical protein